MVQGERVFISEPVRVYSSHRINKHCVLLQGTVQVLRFNIKRGRAQISVGLGEDIQVLGWVSINDLKGVRYLDKEQLPLKDDTDGLMPAETMYELTDNSGGEEEDVDVKVL